MNKRFRYFFTSLISALGFFLFISLPFESRYFGLMAGVVLVIFCFWFGLGILFDQTIYTRLMAVLLPVCLFVGFGLFAVLLPYSFWLAVGLSLLFGLLLYGLFLVENVFLVAIGFKTVPLYRAAYTVSLILLLVASFFMFNSLYSFRMGPFGNGLWAMIIGILVYGYQYWAVSIELPDDGKSKNMWAYIIVPALVTGQLATVLSFWPTGIFKGSVYLVSVIYIVASLIQADIRDRLFRRTWMQYVYIAVAVILAMLSITRWR